MPQFTLPDPGEGLVEAEIVTWKVKAGDEVNVNDIVVEIETAKSLVELPIPWAGTVAEILVPEGETVEVGTPIIVIDTGDGAEVSAPVEEVTADAVEEQADDLVPEPSGSADSGAEPKREAVLVGYGASEGATTRRRRRATEAAIADEPQERRTALAKPPVRKYAKDHGVDLTHVTPAREDGIITRADVDAFLQSSSEPSSGQAAPAVSTPESAPAAPPAASSAPAYQAPALDRSGERETRTPIKGVRKMTAQAMVSSAFTAPHVTEFITIDVTATMELVERLKTDREFRDLKISPLLILAKALCLAVKRNPGINTTWDDDAQEIVQKNYVNLGIAAATPRGLIVPNIKDADLMDLRQLAEAMANLIDTARSGRAQPAEMSGGSITITNVGVFGVDTGTPIINPGESAIVCFGAVKRKPWVVTDADGTEQIVPRWVTELSVSFDHRLVDGELGSRFLADLAAILADPTRALVWG